MIQYIYFVKCPNCEDEHFDFFDEAKEFALGCLSKKPVITQTEVNRNDFGECTDHCDLGTIWSWEDTMGKVEDEPAVSVFTKDDLKTLDNDPEFDDDDFFAINYEEDKVVEHINDRPAPVESTQELHGIDNAIVDCDIAKVITHSEDEKPLACKGKPVPEGMAIEQLVEEMEENEDEVECVCCQELRPKEDCQHDDKHGWICDDCKDEVVECTWCEELYDRSECRYEVDLGWLCDRCEAAIKSRGETLTFREGSYWDFLDEKLDIDFSNCIDSSDMEIYGIESVGENTYKTVLMKKFEDVSFHGLDATQAVHDEMREIGGLFVFYFDKNGNPTLDSWNADLLNSLGSCDILFDDARYENAVQTAFSKAGLSEDFDAKKMETLVYDNLTVPVQTGYVPATREEPEEYITKDYTDSFEYSVPVNNVATTIFENFLTDEEYYELAESENNDKLAWKNLLDRYDEFVEKHYDELLDYYREDAEEAAKDDFQDRYDDRDFDEGLTKKSMLEELEDPDTYRFRLADCPECGASKSYDHETGICIGCGFNFN